MSVKTLAHVGCELVVAMAGLENFSEIVWRRAQMFIFHFPPGHSEQTGPKGQWLCTLPDEKLEL